jgi:hypothetical protein
MRVDPPSPIAQRHVSEVARAVKIPISAVEHQHLGRHDDRGRPFNLHRVMWHGYGFFQEILQGLSST